MTSFSEAVTRREPVEVVHPFTGEIIDLGNAAHDQLVDVFLGLQEQERRVKEWRTAVEDELVRRHGDRRAAQVVGDHEIDVDRGYGRVWDVQDLMLIVHDLIGAGVLRKEDSHGLTKTEVKVDGNKARDLLNRVDGDALVELRRCFHWAQKGRAKVKVTPVATLEP